jgi:hypothetical protein
LLPCARGPDDAIVLTAVSLRKCLPVFQAALQIGRCHKCGIVSHEAATIVERGARPSTPSSTGVSGEGEVDREFRPALVERPTKLAPLALQREHGAANELAFA